MLCPESSVSLTKSLSWRRCSRVGSYWTITRANKTSFECNVKFFFSFSSLAFQIKSWCKCLFSAAHFPLHMFLLRNTGLLPFPDFAGLILTCSLLIFLPAGKYFCPILSSLGVSECVCAYVPNMSEFAGTEHVPALQRISPEYAMLFLFFFFFSVSFVSFLWQSQVFDPLPLPYRLFTGSFKFFSANCC